MRERLLITTAIGLMLGAGAYAQSPSEQPRNSSPPAAQSQNNSNSSAPSASSSTTVFAEFDAVGPEHAVIAFRELKIANDAKPIDPGRGQQ
jgi:hypothetical protein